jgi:hypothetical protein
MQALGEFLASEVFGGKDVQKTLLAVPPAIEMRDKKTTPRKGKE